LTAETRHAIKITNKKREQNQISSPPSTLSARDKLNDKLSNVNFRDSSTPFPLGHRVNHPRCLGFFSGVMFCVGMLLKEPDITV